MSESLHQPRLFPTEETEQRVQYELLREHTRTDGSLKTTEQLRAEYVHLTDEIVRQLTDGIRVEDPVSGEYIYEKPDYVVWLDKSARPVAWLTRDLWPLLAQDENGKVPKIPESRFVNIDREQWVNTVDPNGTGMVDIDRVDESVIRSLRSIFVVPEYKKEGLTEAIDQAPAELDGKTILIIDEVKASGKTLDIAHKFFQRAFPTARIGTTHWMRGMAQIGTAQGNADLPVWYRSDIEEGRGVGNRDQNRSQRSKSTTQRLGGWFLSTALESRDSLSAQLRSELHQLAQGARSGEVLVVPSHQRDDFIERAERLNGMTLDEFKSAKQKIGEI